MTTAPRPFRVLLSPPDVDARDRQALLDAFDSGWVAPAGPHLEAFEAAVAEASGRDHAVALSSGTAALQLGFDALSVGPGDEVWIATLTFAATANAAVHAGARPTFVDVDPLTWTIDVDRVAAELLRRRVEGLAQPAAIVPVDLYGRCADHDGLEPLAREFGVVLFVDAAEAVGARLHGRRAGSFGDAAALSFNGNKMVTTSGGGAFVTDEPRHAERVRFLATQAREPVLHYEHREVGHNFRLSNLLAALGTSQLAGLEDKVARRRAINAAYRVGLADLPGVAFQAHDTEDDEVRGTRSTAWLTCLTIDPDAARAAGAAPVDRDAVIAGLAAAGIESRPVWKPMHLQPVFRRAPALGGEVAARLFERGVALPSGSSLTDDELDEVIAIVRGCWR